MSRSRCLVLEALEDRTLPAVFGVPWSAPSHLTLSFAPDGTQISGESSTLFATLDAQEPTAAWQAAILRAVQTWAVNTNLNVGVVPDGGQPFGTSGLGQGDPRFGDIRIGAAPLSPTVLAVSVPHDPYLSGGWSGEIILNSTINFTTRTTDLSGVLLHELGHVFGLGASPDPASVLYQYATWVTPQLAASDVAAIQALYGAPSTHSANIHTLQTAAPIRYPDDDTPYTGTTPLLAFGALAAVGENDFFSVKTLASYTGPMTFRLQTAGVSVLAPELIVYDANGNVLGQSQSTSPLGDVVNIHLGSVTASATYYVRVLAATSDLFAVGHYGVAVTFDATLQTTPNRIFAMLTAHGDSSDDASPGATVPLRTTPGYAVNQHYETRSSISTTLTYSLLSPQSPSGAPLIMTVALSARSDGGALPQMQVLDANQQPVAAQVLVNRAGGVTIQATGLAPGQTYYLKLTRPASGGEQEDMNFAIVADFKQDPSVLPVVASGSVTTGESQPGYALYVALDQVFHYTLSAADAPGGAAVQMTITDAEGHMVFTLAAPSGQTVSGPALLLMPGAYTIRFTAVFPAGAVAALSFQLRATAISDPIGPVITDPTILPTYTNPGDPFTYYYPDSGKDSNSKDAGTYYPVYYYPITYYFPDGTVTITPYLFVALFY
jgi:hypothetical protein